MAGFIMDEQNFINNNVLLHSDRLESKFSRFLETSPSYVTYFHIDPLMSSVDNGIQNVQQVIGADSPIRFNRIDNFPMYGIESIVPQLELDTYLDSSFEGEAIILPNTIEPLPNDCFFIDYLGKSFFFMVTDVKYSSIKSNSFYNVSYTLKSVDDTKITDVERQTVENHTCIVANIGTEDRAIVQSNDFAFLKRLEACYQTVASQYLEYFYMQKYNTFLFDDKRSDRIRLYDPYLNHFVNRTGVFNRKNDYATIMVTEEGKSPAMYREYRSTLYKAVEKNKAELFTSTLYAEMPINRPDSIFTFYSDRYVRSVGFELPPTIPYVETENVAEWDAAATPVHPIDIVLNKYFNDTVKEFSDIPLNQLEDVYDWFEYDWKHFVLVPVVLYILRTHYDKLIKQ